MSVYTERRVLGVVFSAWRPFGGAAPRFFRCDQGVSLRVFGNLYSLRRR